MDTTKKPDSTVRLIENGPMIISGAFEIKDKNGNRIEFTQAQMAEGVALCRCGKSKNKPLCDGSHSK